MAPDIAVGILTVVMTVLGTIISLHAPSKLAWKLTYVALFLILGVGATIFVVKQSRETSAANRDLADALAKLKTSTKEIERIGGLNTELQKQLIGQSGTITALSKLNVQEVTGGYSFSYVQLSVDLNKTITAFLTHAGANPTSNIDVRIFDVGCADEAKKAGEALGFPSKCERQFNSIPYMRRGSNMFIEPLASYPLTPDTSLKQYNVFINERNGSFTEILLLARLNGQGWALAKLMDATYYNGVSGVVMYDVDKSFPADLLAKSVDWVAMNKRPRLHLRVGAPK